MADSLSRQLSFILPAMTRLDLTDDASDELVRALRGIANNAASRSRRACGAHEVLLEKLEALGRGGEAVADLIAGSVLGCLGGRRA